MEKGGAGAVRSAAPADLSVCGGAARFLQSAFWGLFKGRFGWKPKAFLVEWAASGQGAVSGPTPLLVLWRPLVPGLSFAYVPWPETGVPGAENDGLPPEADPWPPSSILADLARALRPWLPGTTAFVRFDPPWYTEGVDAAAPETEAPLRRAAQDVQPPDTVIVDLRKSEGEILAGMKEKCRYNIRLAARRGVSVRRVRAGGDGAAGSAISDGAVAAALDVFYALFAETAARDGIAMHGREYYAELFALAAECSGSSAPGIERKSPWGGTRQGDWRESPAPAALLPGRRPVPDLRLYLAEHDGQAIAAAIMLFWGEEATYLYGASADRKRNLMAPYLLQWTAMREAKEAGCLRYDLFGIPPDGNPAHPMAGLYRFKTGFGGKIIHRPGSQDFDFRPLMAPLFRAAERGRKSLRKFRRRAGSRGAVFPQS